MRRKLNVFGIKNFIHDAVESSFEDADIVVMPGGGDWSPILYGERRHKSTYFNFETDKVEMKMMVDCIKANKLILGICRGAQGVTILNGGCLVQNVSHPSSHNVIITDKYGGGLVKTNSYHHQMCNPYNLPKEDYELICYTEGLSPVYQGEDGNYDLKNFEISHGNYVKEPEAIWFPKTKGLAIQWHPENLSPIDDSNVFLNKVIETHIGFRLT